MEQDDISNNSSYNLKVIDPDYVDITESVIFDMKLNLGVHSLKFSNSDKFLAAGYRDGRVRIFNMEKSSCECELDCNDSKTETLVQTLKWRPRIDGKTNNILMTACRDTLMEWHTPSRKQVSKFSFGQQMNNKLISITSAEYSNDANQYAVGLTDCSIRVIDGATQKEIISLGGKDQNAHINGHMNKIYALKYHKEDPNVLISAGWDDNILFWDLISGSPFRVMVGPHIHGEGLDINSFGEILTASWRKDDPLEIYDYETGERKKLIDWNFDENCIEQKELPLKNNPEEINIDENPILKTSTQLYCCSYSKDFGKLIYAGGSLVNCVKIFDWKGSGVGVINKLPHACFSLDSTNLFSNEGGQSLAIGCGDGIIRVYSLKYGNKFDKKTFLTV